MDCENARQSQVKVRTDQNNNTCLQLRAKLISCSVFLAITSTTADSLYCFNLIFISFANTTYIALRGGVCAMISGLYIHCPVFGGLRGHSQDKYLTNNIFVINKSKGLKLQKRAVL